MANLMKKMHSPKQFVAGMRKVGEPQNFQNVNLARHMMMTKERSLPPKRSKAQSIGVKMSSLLNTSSHFDRANASTVEGTQMSVQHVFDSSTDVDAAE